MTKSLASESQFQVGAATTRALSAWIMTLPKALPLAIVAHLPLIAWTCQSPSVATDLHEIADGAVARIWGPLLLSQLIQISCTTILSGMIICLAFKHLQREPSSIGTAFSTGMRRIVPVVLIGLAVGGLSVVPIGMVLAMSAVGDPDQLELRIGVASTVTVVVRVIISMMLSAAPGAAVIESHGALTAIKRSLALTEGFRWRILGCTLLVGIVVGIVSGVFGFIAVIGFSSGTEHVAVLIALVTTPLTASLEAVIYHDLRLSKEGVEVADLMRVFA